MKNIENMIDGVLRSAGSDIVEFRNEIWRQGERGSIECMLENNGRHLITDAFNWEKSVKGHVYWSNVNEKVSKLLKNMGY